jgi:hypothetical protein
MTGKKTGGKKLGSLNRTTRLKRSMAAGNEDALAEMRRIARGDVPCGVCHGRGKTKYQPARRSENGEWIVSDPDAGKLAERTCLSCYGSGKEIISPELKAKMWAEIAKYERPQLKAVQVGGDPEKPIQAHLVVEFVRPGNG